MKMCGTTAAYNKWIGENQKTAQLLSVVKFHV